jgi:hypothetical protein
VKIFLSYRRGDTQHFTGRLAERLRHTSGITDIFLDVDSIGAGENFEDRIRAALAQSTVCLVIIGADWLGTTQGGAPRIMGERDFVRLEVRAVLSSNCRILPVLADGATMPSPEQLPAELQPLSSLNALSVRHGAFERDVAHLVDAIFARKPPGAFGAYLRRHPVLQTILEMLAGAVTALVILIFALAVLNAAAGLSLSDVVGGDGPAVLLTALVAALGAATPWFLRRRGILR